MTYTAEFEKALRKGTSQEGAKDTTVTEAVQGVSIDDLKPHVRSGRHIRLGTVLGDSSPHKP